MLEGFQRLYKKFIIYIYTFFSASWAYSRKYLGRDNAQGISNEDLRTQ